MINFCRSYDAVINIKFLRFNLLSIKKMPLHSFIRNDTTIITPNASLRRVINRHTKESLLSIIQKWLQDPITRPNIDDTSEDEQDFDDTNVQQNYEKLGSKKKIVDKVFLEDWVLYLLKEYKNIQLLEVTSF